MFAAFDYMGFITNLCHHQCNFPIYFWLSLCSSVTLILSGCVLLDLFFRIFEHVLPVAASSDIQILSVWDITDTGKTWNISQTAKMKRKYISQIQTIAKNLNLANDLISFNQNQNLHRNSKENIIVKMCFNLIYIWKSGKHE